MSADLVRSLFLVSRPAPRPSLANVTNALTRWALHAPARTATAGSIALLLGPSGCGKSTLLRRCCRAVGASTRLGPSRTLVTAELTRFRVRVHTSASAGTLIMPGPQAASTPACQAPALPAALQACRMPEAETSRLFLGCLVAAGLAEAGLMLLPVRRLSAGQRARHTLAVAMFVCRLLADRARHVASTDSLTPLLVIDEFGTGLDRPTAVSLAISLRRWCHTSAVRTVVATLDAELGGHLAPAITVDLSPPHDRHATASTSADCVPSISTRPRTPSPAIFSHTRKEAS